MVVQNNAVSLNCMCVLFSKLPGIILPPSFDQQVALIRRITVCEEIIPGDPRGSTTVQVYLRLSCLYLHFVYFNTKLVNWVFSVYVILFVYRKRTFLVIIHYVKGNNCFWFSEHRSLFTISLVNASSYICNYGCT